jgi:RimJ/RimL family protein N-acetyltransferase
MCALARGGQREEDMTMLVRPATDSDLEMIAGWLAEPHISRWLDFGTGRPLTALAMKYAIAQGTKRLFKFTPAEGREDAPIGVVGLSAIHPKFRTAELWYALGEPRFAGRRLTSRAAAEVVRIGFYELKLRAIHAWAVVGNDASVRILEKIGFRQIGRQRQCHSLKGQLRDRLLFDIVPADLAGCVSPSHGRKHLLAIAHSLPVPPSVVDGTILAAMPWG